MAAPVLVAAVAEPSDAELVGAVASLLAAMPGAFVQPRLSELIGSVCSALCRTPADCHARAGRLVERFAAYLHERHVVKSAQVTVAGLDEWASHARVDVVRCALLAHAQRLRSGGDTR